jgi:DNA-binding response OmpR family regulator
VTKAQTIAELQDRIEELETILGTGPLVSMGYRALGLSEQPRQILGILMNRPLAARDQIFVAVYGGRPEASQPDIKTVDVQMSTIRAALRVIGAKISTHQCVGWSLEPSEKQKIKDWLADYMAKVERGAR